MTTKIIKNAEYLSIIEAAGFLNISPITIRRMIASGDLQGFKVGKRIIRISFEELNSTLIAIPNARSK